MNPLKLKAYLGQTFQRILEPLARIALRGELSYKEFSDAAKRAFFKVAREDHGISGRKTNLARVSILTGFSRKECSRLKALEDEPGPRVSEAVNPCARVISAWHEDERYLDSSGQPIELPVDESNPSLATLVDEYAGDMPPVAIVKELESMGIIVRNSKGRYKVTRRNFIPQEFDQDKVRILGNQLSDLGSTIFFNLVNKDPEATRLQRYVVEEAVPQEVAERFQQLATEKSQELLEELDAMLNGHSKQIHKTSRPKTNSNKRVGVGVYFFSEPSNTGTKS